jgi:hypothetical protein
VDIADKIRKQAERRKGEIARKIHPVLPIILRHYKDTLDAAKALPDRPPAELVDTITARFVKKLKLALRKYPTLPPQLGDFVYTCGPSNEQIGMLEFLHFNRHGKPLAPDLYLARTRKPDAWKRVILTEQDYATVVCAAGRVKASKADPTHADVFLFGIGLGLEELTEEELADFFDNYCWRGSAHDGKALKKQQKRTIQNFFSNAVEAGWPPQDVLPAR